MQIDRRILVTVAGSLALHGIVLFYFVDRQPARPTKQVTPTIDLTLAREPPSVPPAESISPDSDQDPEPDPEPAPPVKPPAVAEAHDPRRAEMPTDVRPSGRQLAAMLLGSISDEAVGAAWGVYQRPECPDPLVESGIRLCNGERAEPHDAESARYAALFREAFAHVIVERDRFDHDMKRVANLLATADQLAAVNPDDELQAALIRSQHAQIMDQVQRIDARYASVNLLRVFPMGIKAFRGLKERIQ